MIIHVSITCICFVHEVENQMDKSLKTLRTDKGREYLFDQFRSLCEEKGIVRHLTIPDTPQQNGVQNDEIGLCWKWLDRCWRRRISRLVSREMHC